MDGEDESGAVNSSGCSVGREGDRRKACDGEGRHGPSELAPASDPERDRGGKRGGGRASEHLYHDVKLHTGEVVEWRRRNGGASRSSELGNGGGTN